MSQVSAFARNPRISTLPDSWRFWQWRWVYPKSQSDGFQAAWGYSRIEDAAAVFLKRVTTTLLWHVITESMAWYNNNKTLPLSLWYFSPFLLTSKFKKKITMNSSLQEMLSYQAARNLMPWLKAWRDEPPSWQFCWWLLWDGDFYVTFCDQPQRSGGKVRSRIQSPEQKIKQLFRVYRELYYTVIYIYIYIGIIYNKPL